MCAGVPGWLSGLTDMSAFDVRIHAIHRRPDRRPFEVRWPAGGRARPWIDRRDRGLSGPGREGHREYANRPRRCRCIAGRRPQHQSLGCLNPAGRPGDRMGDSPGLVWRPRRPQHLDTPGTPQAFPCLPSSPRSSATALPVPKTLSPNATWEYPGSGRRAGRGERHPAGSMQAVSRPSASAARVGPTPSCRSRRSRRHSSCRAVTSAARDASSAWRSATACAAGASCRARLARRRSSSLVSHSPAARWPISSRPTVSRWNVRGKMTPWGGAAPQAALGGQPSPTRSSTGGKKASPAAASGMKASAAHSADRHRLDSSRPSGNTSSKTIHRALQARDQGHLRRLKPEARPRQAQPRPTTDFRFFRIEL